MEPSYSALEKIAQGIHDSYLAHRRAEGQTAATNAVLVPWTDLPTHLKNSNRETARQLWGRLEVFGYDIVLRTDPGEMLSHDELMSHLEVLSEMGHIRWMNQRISMGWTYDKGPKNVEKRTSPCLVSWNELPMHEQEKERQILRDLHGILAVAGLKIVRATNRAVHPRDLISEPTVIPGREEPDPSAGGPSRGQVEALAHQLHENYVSHRMAAGENVIENPSMRPWERLDPALQRSNRSTAADYWKRLHTVGYEIVILAHPEPEITPAELGKHFEALSEAGHVGWMNQRKAAGWTYAPGAKDIQKRTHPGLIDWKDLPEPEREKERQQLRDLPRLLRAAGLKIIRGVVSGFDPPLG